MTVTVENIRGGQNIQVPLIFNLPPINIEYKPNETARVSSVLNLEEYCTSRRDYDPSYYYQSDPGGDTYRNPDTPIEDRRKGKRYYTSGELTAYIFVGVLSSLLLVIIVLGVLWYLKRRKRKLGSI